MLPELSDNDSNSHPPMNIIGIIQRITSKPAALYKKYISPLNKWKKALLFSCILFTVAITIFAYVFAAFRQYIAYPILIYVVYKLIDIVVEIFKKLKE